MGLFGIFHKQESDSSKAVVATEGEVERALAWIGPCGLSKEEVGILDHGQLRVLNDAWRRIGLISGGVLIPKGGEVIYGQKPKVALHRFHEVRQRKSGGASIRVARGIWLHSGSSGTTGVARRLWQHDIGALYLTTRRAYYAGSGDNLEFRFAKLDKFPTWYRDGFLSLPHGSREELFKVGNGDDAKAWAIFIEFLIRHAQGGS